MGDAGGDGGIDCDGTFVSFDGLREHSAKTEYLDEAGERFGFAGMTLEAFEQAREGFVRVASVDLHEGVELVGGGEVGIEGEGALKGGVG